VLLSPGNSIFLRNFQNAQIIPFTDSFDFYLNNSFLHFYFYPRAKSAAAAARAAAACRI
jgi:hypothetical protein